MAVGSKPRLLGYGRTADDVNTPLLVGGDGTLGGNGEPASDTTGSIPMKLLCGRTSTGLNVPLRVDSAGRL